MSSSFQNTTAYLYSRLEVLKADREALCRKYNNNQLEIIEYDNRIKNLSEKIDMAYEIFSPKNNEISFTHKELKNFDTKKAVLIQENIDIHKQITAIENEEKAVAEAIEELEDAHEPGAPAYINLREDYVPESGDGKTRVGEENAEQETAAQGGFDEKTAFDTAVLNADTQQYTDEAEAKPLPASTVFDKVDFCVNIFDLDPRRVKIELANLLASFNK